MSNPQWKMFQPPETHSSPLQDILDLQHSNMQPKASYRNGECIYVRYCMYYLLVKLTLTFVSIDATGTAGIHLFTNCCAL